MKIGFIGCGSMGSAMIYCLQNEQYDIYVYDIDCKKVDYLIDNYNVQSLEGINGISNMDVVFLAVEPKIVIKLLKEYKNQFEKRIVVSIAAGVTIEQMIKISSTKQKIVRAMPNAPALIGEGMTSLAFANLNEQEKETVLDIFNKFGKAVVLSEEHFDAFTSICGSSPAFVFMFIESLANAGVLQGIPRELAYQVVAQTVQGSAKMLLQYDEHPARLKDGVCSPNGATIEGVAELEKRSFRNAIIQAAVRTGDKSKRMTYSFKKSVI